jgi:hypothetical protein
MRPLDDAFSSSTRPRSKPSSVSSRSPSPRLRGHGLGTPGAAGGMTYFLTEENNFGVHSMSESALSPSASSPAREELESSEQTQTEEMAVPVWKDVSGARETMETGDTGFAIPSHVVTPSIGSTVSSTFSTPSSPHQNLSSSAISDDSELELSSHHDDEPSSIISSFPQLVMPRVTMPRRKPFTEAGRTMGKLKIMVVGDSCMQPMTRLIIGIGKSSLIQAILETSPDIVHYDPPQSASSVTSSSSFIKPSLSRRATLESHFLPPTDNILEIKASTCAYPPWWKSETEREKSARPALGRRESMGEVLERNICFVDTPGYGSSDDVPLSSSCADVV